MIEQHVRVTFRAGAIVCVEASDGEINTPEPVVRDNGGAVLASVSVKRWALVQGRTALHADVFRRSLQLTGQAESPLDWSPQRDPRIIQLRLRRGGA